MKYQVIDDILLTKEKIIPTNEGDVLHAMKNGEQGFEKFGEAYFSEVLPKTIKGWKRHKHMILNLLVPIGQIKFIFFDQRPGSNSFEYFQEVTVSRLNYVRITLPPMIWFSFENTSDEKALLLNLANIPHDPNEVEYKDINEISIKSINGN